MCGLAEEQMHSASALVGVGHRQHASEFHHRCQWRLHRLDARRFSWHPFNAFWLLGGNAAQTIFDAGNLLHFLLAAKQKPTMINLPGGPIARCFCRRLAERCRHLACALQYDADALKAARDFERAAKISLDLSRQQLETGQANVLFLLLAQQTYLTGRGSGLCKGQLPACPIRQHCSRGVGRGWWNRSAAAAGEDT